MKKSAKHIRDSKHLSEVDVYKRLKSLFPKVNNYAASESGYTEELNEKNYHEKNILIYFIINSIIHSCQ